jgi:hypothetical protein
MIGVGTKMNVQDYTELSELIVKDSNIATVVVDHRPGNPFKHAWSSNDRGPRTRLAQLVNQIHQNIDAFIHNACHSWIMVVGGHSGSGLTALETLQDNLTNFTTAAFLGLDPALERLPMLFPYTDFSMTLPVLVWGFSCNTCLVTQTRGSQAVYARSRSSHRVLYQFQTNTTNTGHCDFTNQGCAPVCGLSNRSSIVKLRVAESIRKLVIVLSTPQVGFNRTNLAVASRSEVNMYINQDLLPGTF